MKRQGMQVARLMGWLLVWPLLMVMAGAEAADTAPAARTGRLQLQQGSVDGATPFRSRRQVACGSHRRGCCRWPRKIF